MSFTQTQRAACTGPHHCRATGRNRPGWEPADGPTSGTETQVLLPRKGEEACDEKAMGDAWRAGIAASIVVSL